MKTIPTNLSIFLHYLNWESGNVHVKERLENTYGWLQSKLSRIADHELINELQANPSDPEVQQRWREILDEAADEDDLFSEELSVRLKETVEQIQSHDPKGYQTLVAKQKGLRSANQ